MGLATRLRRRLQSEESGFTLVELTIVLLILGIVLTIAVPSYLSFKDKAYKQAARANIAEANRAIISYGADNYPNAPSDPNGVTDDNGYENISLSLLSTHYDATISATPGDPFVLNPNGWNGNVSSPTDFCITAVSGRWIAAQHGPGAPIEVGTLFTPGTCTVS